MPEELEPEFQHAIDAVATLEKVAIEHEAKQIGPHKGPCYENRTYLIALAMDKLDLAVSDVGFVAEHLFEIQCEAEHDCGGEHDPTNTPDEILDAKEFDS